MHHLLANLPLENLAFIPFQPHSTQSIPDAAGIMDGIFPQGIKVSLPPLSVVLWVPMPWPAWPILDLIIHQDLWLPSI